MAIDLTIPNSMVVASIDDLLTHEERQKLNADLAAMAVLRRRAEAEAANVIVG